MMCQNTFSSGLQQASFRAGTRGNAVRIVKVFTNAKNALNYRILRTQPQNFSTAITPRSPQAPLVLGPRHQYPLGLPAFQLFLFCETTTAATVVIDLMFSQSKPSFNSLIFGRLFHITAGTLVSNSVNGDIAIQWEWSNFDPSQNPNPLTDYDKTIHN